MGLTRTRLLTARLGLSDAEQRRVRRLVDVLRADLPALDSCALLARVLEHWDAWVGWGEDPGGSGDRFWGV